MPLTLCSNVGRALQALGLGCVVALAAPCASAQAQAGAIYRCGASDFTNALSDEQAASRHCVKIGSTEWLFSGADGDGRQYTYNDRRTVVRGDGTVETWVQVVLPARRADDVAAPSDQAFVRTVSPHVISCRQRTISAGPTYHLDVRDNSVRKEADPRTAMFPPPENVARTLIDRVCGSRAADVRAVAARVDAAESRGTKTAMAVRGL